MKKRDRFILGGIVGFFLASFVTSTYFYRIYKKLSKVLRENLANYDY